MKVERNRVYVFMKSGNRVRALCPTTCGGKGNWVVRRVDGSSAGKELVVPAVSLLPVAQALRV